MKVNITLDDELMARVDRYADENYMSRSGLISLATTQFLNQYDIVSWSTFPVSAILRIAIATSFQAETISY